MGLIKEFVIRTPDAIQLAAAKYSSVDYFLTNDIRLKKFKDLDILVLADL